MNSWIFELILPRLKEKNAGMPARVFPRKEKERNLDWQWSGLDAHTIR